MRILPMRASSIQRATKRLRIVIAAPALGPVPRCWIVETKLLCGRARHDYLKGRPADNFPLTARNKLCEWRDESSPAAPSSTRTASQRAESCRQRETEAEQAPGATGRQMAGGKQGADTHAPRLLGDTSVPGDRTHPGPISWPLGSRNGSGRRQFGSVAAAVVTASQRGRA